MRTPIQSSSHGLSPMADCRTIPLVTKPPAVTARTQNLQDTLAVRAAAMPTTLSPSGADNGQTRNNGINNKESTNKSLAGHPAREVGCLDCGPRH